MLEYCRAGFFTASFAGRDHQKKVSPVALDRSGLTTATVAVHERGKKPKQCSFQAHPGLQTDYSVDQITEKDPRI